MLAGVKNNLPAVLLEFDTVLYLPICVFYSIWMNLIAQSLGISVHPLIHSCNKHLPGGDIVSSSGSVITWIHSFIHSFTLQRAFTENLLCSSTCSRYAGMTEMTTLWSLLLRSLQYTEFNTVWHIKRGTAPVSLISKPWNITTNSPLPQFNLSALFFPSQKLYKLFNRPLLPSHGSYREPKWLSFCNPPFSLLHPHTREPCSCHPSTYTINPCRHCILGLNATITICQMRKYMLKLRYCPQTTQI